MIIDFTQLPPASIYHTMTQTVVPRPIAWVLTSHDNGQWNVAPFSYFNAVSSHPPLVSLSVGRKRDGSRKIPGTTLRSTRILLSISPKCGTLMQS